MPRTSPVGDGWIFEFGVPNTETDKLLQVGCRGSWASLRSTNFTSQSTRLQHFFFLSQQALSLTQRILSNIHVRGSHCGFHCGPDWRGAPISSLSLGQQGAGSCDTIANNTINSPWLINWLQTNPAASLCTLLCVTFLSCLSSHCHVQERYVSVKGKNTWKTLIWPLLYLHTLVSVVLCFTALCFTQHDDATIRHYLHRCIAATEFESILVVFPTLYRAS